MFSPLANNEYQTELDARSGMTAGERLAIRPLLWGGDLYEAYQHERGDWRVTGGGVWRSHRWYDTPAQAFEHGDEIEFREQGVVYAGTDPLAIDKALRYQRDHRRDVARDRAARKGLGRWLRRQERAADKAVSERMRNQR